MLTQYLTDTKNLLQNPVSPTNLYDTTSLTRWINIARGQVAGEGECIRRIGTIQTVIGQREYNFSDISFGVAATTGIQGAIHIRRINYGVASGQKKLTVRAWEWFDLYHLNNPVPTSGEPSTWTQYGQGSAGTSTGANVSGTFYIDPLPDVAYTLYCDCCCYPVALVDDTTKEAIPYLWTDSVSFFAAYYAYLSAQTGARQADAERMFGHYQTFLERARKAANSSVNRYLYEQAGEPTATNKLGMQKSAQ